MNKKNIALMIVVAIIAIFSATDTANAYTLGQTGPEIANLQISLIESGYDIPLITSGAARPGYFGTQTQAALAKRDAGGIIFGANAGQDSYFPYVGNNNVQRWTYRSSFRNGTTTPCAYRNTAGATTTIDFASVLINTGTSTATVWTIATSTTPYATTTLLTSQSLATTQQGNVVYRGATGGVHLAPGAYIVWGVAGIAIGSDAVLRGSCQAEVTRL